jgi:hypothetical protein
MIMAPEAAARVTSNLGDRADGSVNQVKLNFVGGKPLQQTRQRFGRAVHIALDDDAKLLHFAGLHMEAQVLERDPAGLGQYTLAMR